MVCQGKREGKDLEPIKFGDVRRVTFEEERKHEAEVWASKSNG